MFNMFTFPLKILSHQKLPSKCQRNLHGTYMAVVDLGNLGSDLKTLWFETMNLLSLLKLNLRLKCGLNLNAFLPHQWFNTRNQIVKYMPSMSCIGPKIPEDGLIQTLSYFKSAFDTLSTKSLKYNINSWVPVLIPSITCPRCFPLLSKSLMTAHITHWVLSKYSAM